MVMSVKDASPARIRLTPEGTNDRSPWRRVGGWVKDTLMLFDLGCFGYAFFTRIDENGGFFISRLKANANPVEVAQNRQWRGQSKPVVTKRLRDALDGLQREVLAVVVEVAFDRRAYRGYRRQDTRTFHVVGVLDDVTGEYHLFVTNIPVDQLDGHEVASTYRLRWQIAGLLVAVLASVTRRRSPDDPWLLWRGPAPSPGGSPMPFERLTDHGCRRHPVQPRSDQFNRRSSDRRITPKHCIPL